MADQVYKSPIYAGLTAFTAERAKEAKEKTEYMFLNLIYHHCTQTVAVIEPGLYYISMHTRLFPSS